MDKVLYVFRRRRTQRLQNMAEGQGPNEMLYGLNQLDPARYTASYIEGDDTRWTFFRLVCYPLELWIARVTKMGFALHMALDNFQELRKADLIISTVDTCGLPIALLKRLGLLRAPMLYISQGLSDRINALTPRPFLHRLFHSFYRTLLRAVEQIVVLGEGAVKPLAETFALPLAEVKPIPFGIDAEFWQPATEPITKDYVLSVGSDLARDYDTLLKAITHEQVKIVTRLPLPPAEIKPTVEVGTNYTDVELRELYRQARFVVTPLKDVAQPTGQSASLQAMACGKCVVLSAIQGLWESEYLRHGETCYLVKPGDVADLQRALEYLMAHTDEAQRIGQNARRLVEQRYTSQHFARSLETSIESLLHA
jgi:glycosyltransferase involved in cell wall biosynthesis